MYQKSEISSNKFQYHVCLNLRNVGLMFLKEEWPSDLISSVVIGLLHDSILTNEKTNDLSERKKNL